jgi:hypothetical protein
LEFVLQEFIELWHGIPIVLSNGEVHTLRGMLLYTLTDSRAMPKINQQVQSPAIIGACHECHVVGKRYGDSTIYCDHYRFNILLSRKH